MYASVQEVFEKGFPARFCPEQAQGEHVTFLFRVKGEGDRYVAIIDRSLIVSPKLELTSPEEFGAVDVTVNILAEDFLNIANGKEALQLLFMTGRLTLEGDLATALKLIRFFPVVE